MTLVSIVTPSYQQSPFLEETILSVLDQEYPAIEYMVVDGGSTDGSVEIIQHYQDRLAWWVSEKDAGQSAAINKGFRRVNGEIVGWLNSDDVLMPGAVQKVVETFAANPDAALVYGDVYSIDEEGKIFNKTLHGAVTLTDLMQFTIISQPAVFVRTKLLKAVGYVDETFHYLMDHHLWLKLAQEGELVHIPVVLAKARYHASAKNIAQAQNFGMDAFRLVGWMRSQPNLDERLRTHHFWKQVEASAHRFNARYLLDAEKFKAAWRQYWKAFLLSPRAALKEWHRWLYTGLCLLGFKKLSKVFYRFKRSRKI